MTSVPRPLSSSLRALVALCGALLLGGCGVSVGGTAGVVGSASPSPSPSAVASPSAAASPSAVPSSSASSRTTGPARPSGASPTTTDVRPGPPGFSSFTTPSRNIACYVDSGDPQDGGEARCDIAQADWHPTPKPDSCHYAWGPALTVGPDRAGFGCVSDSANNDNVVPYGTRETRGDFTCEVEQAGVTCSDLATGHGFSVSRQSYRFF